MTTWIPFCSVGLDIQSVAREGCRGATQQMHSSQQDALLLLGTAWKLVRQCRRWWWESPWVVFFPALFILSGSFFFFLVTTCPSCLLGHPTGSYLFQPPLSTCSSCLRVTGCFCLYPAAGHELIMRTQGFSVSITKLWHHHITHTNKHTFKHTYTRRHASVSLHNQKQTRTLSTRAFSGTCEWSLSISKVFVFSLWRHFRAVKST